MLRTVCSRTKQNRYKRTLERITRSVTPNILNFADLLIIRKAAFPCSKNETKYTKYDQEALVLQVILCLEEFLLIHVFSSRRWRKAYKEFTYSEEKKNKICETIHRLKMNTTCGDGHWITSSQGMKRRNFLQLKKGGWTVMRSWAKFFRIGCSCWESTERKLQRKRRRKISEHIVDVCSKKKFLKNKRAHASAKKWNKVGRLNKLF